MRTARRDASSIGSIGRAHVPTDPSISPRIFHDGFRREAELLLEDLVRRAKRRSRRGRSPGRLPPTTPRHGSGDADLDHDARARPRAAPRRGRPRPAARTGSQQGAEIRRARARPRPSRIFFSAERHLDLASRVAMITSVGGPAASRERRSAPLQHDLRLSKPSGRGDVGELLPRRARSTVGPSSALSAWAQRQPRTRARRTAGRSRGSGSGGAPSSARPAGASGRPRRGTRCRA